MQITRVGLLLEIMVEQYHKEAIMALPKRVKVGGSYYKGHELAIASAAGDYTLAVVPSTTAFAVNGLAITPTSSAAGDYFSVLHVATTGVSGGDTIATLADKVYNIGGGVSIMLDFATLELVGIGESIRFIYHNTASQAMNCYVTVEVVR